MSDTVIDENVEADISNATPEAGQSCADPEDVDRADTPEDADPEVFPRAVVEELRQESGRYRQRARDAEAERDELARRLHTELVRGTGKLADPTDLPFDPDHLPDAGKMVAAIDELLTAKPHLAARRPVGDVGQGHRGGTGEGVSLLGLLKERT